MSSDQYKAFASRLAPANAALHPSVPQKQHKAAANSWRVALAPALLALAVLALATPAQAARPDPDKKPTTTTTHTQPAHTAQPAKPIAAHSGAPTARLQAANAAAAKPQPQKAGTTVAQRNAALHTLARNQSTPAYRSSGFSCVPYARSVTGMAVSGNAWQWWTSAAGTYERGFRPEPGAVLNFRSTGHMRLGHVAVVSRVINTREIEIDHANWAGGGVSRGVAVMDVSEANDWSAVRVSLGHNSSTFGSVYPTYGFIYNRADHGHMIANTLVHPQKMSRFEEVAEAPIAAPVRRQSPVYIDATLGGR